MKSTVTLSASVWFILCVGSWSAAAATVKLKTGEIVEGEIQEGIALKRLDIEQRDKMPAKIAGAAIVYTLIRGHDVVSIDYGGVHVQSFSKVRTTELSVSFESLKPTDLSSMYLKRFLDQVKGAVLSSSESLSFGESTFADELIGGAWQAGGEMTLLSTLRIETKTGVRNIAPSELVDYVGYQARGKLLELGYDPGPVDGRSGKKAEQAIRLFQQKHELPSTGKLDAITLAYMTLEMKKREGRRESPPR
jgi:hypothetical protein